MQKSNIKVGDTIMCKPGFTTDDVKEGELFTNSKCGGAGYNPYYRYTVINITYYLGYQIFWVKQSGNGVYAQAVCKVEQEISDIVKDILDELQEL